MRHFGSGLGDHLPQGAYDFERRAGHGDKYLDWPAEHVPTYLRRVLVRMEKGDWIPDLMGGYLTTEGSETKPWAVKLKEVFLN